LLHDLSVRVIEPDVAEVLAFCAEDPIERVFLEDVARRGIGRFKAIRGRAGLRALCHVGANVVPSGRRCGDFARAVRDGSARARMIIGEEQAVDDLWDAVCAALPPPRDDRPGQPVFVIREPPELGGTALRAATPADYDLLLPACAAAHREELGVDPLERDGDSFRWRTRVQIDDGRSWVWIDGDTILFKAEASAWTPTAVQIQQVWVDPEVRNRGHAQRGMRDLCRYLLDQVAAVTLFVRPENAAAIRVYEAIGMERAMSYRSLIF
jgi:ribosomal protein S18 acetylase RimI-like enzyme